MEFEREVWQAFITNNSGDVQPNAQITVFDAGTSNLSTIYSGLTGAPRSNPFNTGSDGLAKFYAEPARYRVQAQTPDGIAVFDDVDLSQKALREDLSNPESEVLIAGEPAKDVVALREDLANGTARINGRVNVREFGVVGDGVTDDLSSFQDAFDYAKANGLDIYIPKAPNFYLTSDTILLDGAEGINIYIATAAEFRSTGAHAGYPIYEPVPEIALAQAFIVLDNCTRCHTYGGVFNGEAGSYGTGIKSASLSGKGIMFKNCNLCTMNMHYFKNIGNGSRTWGAGNHHAKRDIGGFITQSKDCEINNCEAKGCGYEGFSCRIACDGIDFKFNKQDDDSGVANHLLQPTTRYGQVLVLPEDMYCRNVRVIGNRGRGKSSDITIHGIGITLIGNEVIDCPDTPIDIRAYGGHVIMIGNTLRCGEIYAKGGAAIGLLNVPEDSYIQGNLIENFENEYESSEGYAGTFYGVNILSNVDDASINNARYGRGAGYNAVGEGNTFIGGSSAGRRFTGSDSALIGTNAGLDATGERLVALGRGAGQASVGDHNVFHGFEAGNQAEGSDIIAAGYRAGRQSTSSESVFYGNGAGEASSGNRNMAFGAKSMRSFVGENSIFLGFEAGDGAAGDEHIGLGYRAGRQSNSPESVFFGYEAGASSSGNRNIGFGRRSTRSLVGENNIFFGYESGEGVAGDDSIGLGYRAGRNSTTSESVFYGNGAGEASSGNRNMAFGAKSMRSFVGENNIFFGFESGDGASGDDCIGLGYRAGKGSTAYTNWTVMGKEINPTSSNQFKIGNKQHIEIDTLGFEEKPDNPGATQVRIYSRLSGGVRRLAVLFPSGEEVFIATDGESNN